MSTLKNPWDGKICNASKTKSPWQLQFWYAVLVGGDQDPDPLAKPMGHIYKTVAPVASLAPLKLLMQPEHFPTIWSRNRLGLKEGRFQKND